MIQTRTAFGKVCRAGGDRHSASGAAPRRSCCRRWRRRRRRPPGAWASAGGPPASPSPTRTWPGISLAPVTALSSFTNNCRHREGNPERRREAKKEMDEEVMRHTLFNNTSSGQDQLQERKTLRKIALPMTSSKQYKVFNNTKFNFRQLVLGSRRLISQHVLSLQH